MTDPTAPLRGVAVGAGYFSQFHYDAWQRLPDASLVALCDRDEARARAMADRFGIARVYTDAAVMLGAERPDFVDIITPAETHAALCHLAGARGVHVLCQKPLAPTFDAAIALVSDAERDGIRLMVHDNFRFQPWHRELHRLLQEDAIGRLHAIAGHMRMGDGWGSDAYLARQPYFRDMPRLLVFETGVHIVDVFRYLAGEIRTVYARLRRLNPVIKGEDRALILFEFDSGATGLWDANRYNELFSSDRPAPDPRYTFGAFLLEGDRGALRVDEDGRLRVQALGEPAREHAYVHARRGFAGDCVFATLRHFLERLRDGAPFETSGRDYLRTLAVQEAIYRSAATGQPVTIAHDGI